MSMKRLLFLTGRPGVGKTTVLLNAAEELKAKGYCVGGMISKEVRREGKRIGFEIVDFRIGARGWLARIEQCTGPQVGKYRVNLSDLDSIGANAVFDASKSADVVIIDEVGPMELFSQAFREAVNEALGSRKLVLAVIHQSARDPIIESIKKRDDVFLATVGFANRKDLHNVLIQNALQYLQEGKR
jgi:nucleoside-triphosphatase